MEVLPPTPCCAAVSIHWVTYFFGTIFWWSESTNKCSRPIIAHYGYKVLLINGLLL